MKVWRICRERYVDAALSGEGARFAAGRWNSLGVGMAYASLSLSLAALEVFVHVKANDEPEDLVSVCADVPVDEKAVEADQRRMLPRLTEGWRFANPRITRAIGDAWIAGGMSLTLAAPSVVIEGEWNLLVNPAHWDARRIKIVEMKPFRFDPRMFKSGR